MWSKLKSELDDGSFDTQSCDAHQLISYTASFLARAAALLPEHMSGDEFSNLSGQLQSAIRRCEELGLIGELQKELPPAIFEQIKEHVNVHPVA